MQVPVGTYSTVSLPLLSGVHDGAVTRLRRWAVGPNGLGRGSGRYTRRDGQSGRRSADPKGEALNLLAGYVNSSLWLLRLGLSEPHRFTQKVFDAVAPAGNGANTHRPVDTRGRLLRFGLGG
jgi:hypothetical protein